MRCIIVDDEGMARVHLEYLCQKIESIEIVGTFKDAMSAYRFLKVHRSFIVNLDKIKDIEDGNLLIGDKVIPVSRNHRAQLMARIMPL